MPKDWQVSTITLLYRNRETKNCVVALRKLYARILAARLERLEKLIEEIQCGFRKRRGI